MPWSTDDGEIHVTEASSLGLKPGEAPGVMTLPTDPPAPTKDDWKVARHNGELISWEYRVDEKVFIIFND